MHVKRRTLSHMKLKAAAFFTASTMALAIAGSPIADAQTQKLPSVSARVSAMSVQQYWTPERLKSAVSLDAVVSTAPGSAKASEMAPMTGQKSQKSVGSPPKRDVGDSLKQQLFVPDAAAAKATSDPEPANFGTSGFYHTTSRVFPAVADRTYPNRAAGKLFFSDTVHGGNFQCSASVIQRRIVVTAGHCVAHGSPDAGTRHFYSNFLFIPAYRDGLAPFGSYSWAFAVTTNNWFLSGAVPNSQDVAMIEVQDIVRGGILRRIGEVTGWLGWWTLWGREYPNNITQLGYPCNLDACGKMQITHAQGVRIVNNNVEIGSAQQGGSSGGPWIQDHGVASVGAPAFTAGNWVLGVTSYQYLGDPSPQILGASIFQNAGFPGHGFGDVWNSACAHRVGNCS